MGRPGEPPRHKRAGPRPANVPRQPRPVVPTGRQVWLADGFQLRVLILSGPTFVISFFKLIVSPGDWLYFLPLMAVSGVVLFFICRSIAQNDESGGFWRRGKHN